ncbi:transposase [Escherichia coli]|uniref:IS66 family transposase n=1 Tax=Escherichia TaxID=561 RepID=UPI000B7E8043|nr:hypothetical protein [Salmonella enterica]EDH0372645.1 transposase [Salmonella enterica subsp. enterica serovar Typhimurium]EDS5872757.1 transposase [Salmonella enterica subsp. enterica serovar Mississippi]EEV1141849.1 transposase [Escherichia coli O157:H7]EFD4162903.1 transposase [Escherichia coli]EFN6672776.1 hypothetical protein [Escherichia coli O8:H10]EHE7437223.1 transposase [Salmonella enterica subsp. enterica serovar Michigan]EHG0170421.1 transposase [Salmonella enterica subsp. en
MKYINDTVQHCEIRGLPEPEQLTIRQVWLKPLLASLHARIEKNATQSSKFRLEKVFSYVLNQRGALSYYSEVDLAETDNNHTERDLRAV